MLILSTYWLLLLIVWMLICWLHYSLWCSNCLIFGQWKLLSNGFYVLLTFSHPFFLFFFHPHHTLPTFLLTGTRRCFGFILYFLCPGPSYSHHEAESSPALELHQTLAEWTGGWRRDWEGKLGWKSDISSHSAHLYVRNTITNSRFQISYKNDLS